MWDIKNSKFYSELTAGFLKFFGRSAENTTEAELHNLVTEAGTLEEIKANAKAEAEADVTAKFSDFQTQLNGLSEKLTAMETAASEKDGKIGELEASVAEMQAKATEKDATIQAQVDKINALSGELASLKAGKPLAEQAPPADGGLAIPASEPNTKKANVLTMADIAKF